ncbi:hypothetical protein GCM10020331_086900 [Ectobacillus funiculus]
MITVDPASTQATNNPEFYVMKHFFLISLKLGQSESKRRGLGQVIQLHLKNPDGSKVVVVANPSKEVQELRLADGGVTHQLLLEPESFNTIVL